MAEPAAAYFSGGSPCAGKSTVAAVLAAKHGLQVYSCDAALERHAAAATELRSPTLARLRRMNWDAIFLAAPGADDARCGAGVCGGVRLRGRGPRGAAAGAAGAGRGDGAAAGVRGMVRVQARRVRAPVRVVRDGEPVDAAAAWVAARLRLGAER